MVYTANWGIIYHLPPLKGTRNSYWKNPRQEQPSLIGTGSCGPEFTRRDIYLDIVGFQPQQTQEIFWIVCVGGVKNGAKQCVWSIFFWRFEDVEFSYWLMIFQAAMLRWFTGGYFHNYLARWWFQWLCQFWFLFLMEKPFHRSNQIIAPTGGN